MDHSPPTQAITVDDFEAFLALPENSDRLFELIDKEIVEVMSPNGDFVLLVKGDLLTDDALLPGFALPVADIFDLENE